MRDNMVHIIVRDKNHSVQILSNAVHNSRWHEEGCAAELRIITS